MTTHYDLTGKLALVTGASSGLGEHFAKTLAAQGATVVLAARRLEKLNALKQDIENDGGKAFAVRMDVTSLSSVEAAFAAIQSEFKRPCDTLINNSGVAHSSWFVDTDEEEWNAVIDTNLSGAWRVAKHAAKAMIADQQPGSISQYCIDYRITVIPYDCRICCIEGGCHTSNTKYGVRTRPLSNSRKFNFSRLFHDTD